MAEDPTFERILRGTRHPVRFADNRVERCLTLSEAVALKIRIELAIEAAHKEAREQTSTEQKEGA